MDVLQGSWGKQTGERTAAIRSTSNRLLRMKQASASSILQAVSGARGHGSRGERQIKRERERESGSEEERRHRKEGVVMLLRERTKEKKKGRTIEQQTNQCVFQAHAVYGWDSRRRGDREIKHTGSCSCSLPATEPAWGAAANIRSRGVNIKTAIRLKPQLQHLLQGRRCCRY